MCVYLFINLCLRRVFFTHPLVVFVSSVFVFYWLDVICSFMFINASPSFAKKRSNTPLKASCVGLIRKDTRKHGQVLARTLYGISFE